MEFVNTESPNFLNRRTPHQIVGKLTRQKKKTRSWLARRMEMTGQKFFSKAHEERYHEELVVIRAPHGSLRQEP